MANETVTAAAQKRRVTKPLMERRRRARINRCLAQLQAFLGSTIAKESQTRGFHRQTRLEKADILEMTVRYIRDTQQKPSPVTLMDVDDQSSSCTFNETPDNNTTEPASQTRFHQGYKLCMSEVANFVRSIQDKGFQISRFPLEVKPTGQSVNVPLKKRRDSVHLSREEASGKTRDLLEHLQNQYETMEGKTTPEMAFEEHIPKKLDDISSAGHCSSAKGQGDALQSLDLTVSDRSAVNKIAPYHRAVPKELIRQNNHFWWRPW